MFMASSQRKDAEGPCPSAESMFCLKPRAGSGWSRLTKIASKVLDHPDTAIDNLFRSSTGESGWNFP